MESWDAAVAWMQTNERLAGWAQALGGFLAVLVAVGAVLLQHYLERRNDRAADARRKAQMRDLLFHLVGATEQVAARLVRTCDRAANGQGSADFHELTAEVVAFHGSLQQLSVSDFDEWEELEALIKTSAAMGMLVSRLSQAHGEQGMGKQWWIALKPAAEIAVEAATKRTNRVAALMGMKRKTPEELQAEMALLRKANAEARKRQRADVKPPRAARRVPHTRPRRWPSPAAGI